MALESPCAADLRRGSVGSLFSGVAHLDLDHHLPVSGNFWEKVLFQSAVYDGNPMAVHHALHAAATLRPDHFQRWFALWAGCIDDLFEGPVADDAKRRAALIAESMQQHLRIASDPEQFTDAYRQALGMSSAAAASGTSLAAL